MIPYIQYGLSIIDDKVVLRYSDKEGIQKKKVLETEKDFKTFLLARIAKYKLNVDDLIVMCSSSMDFPEDSTDNKKTIALAKALR